MKIFKRLFDTLLLKGFHQYHTSYSEILRGSILAVHSKIKSFNFQILKLILIIKSQEQGQKIDDLRPNQLLKFNQSIQVLVKKKMAK